MGLSAAVLALAALLAAPAAPSAAAEGPAAQAAAREIVQVVKVSGLLDPVLVAFASEQIRSAPDDGVVAVVLQLNSSGSVVGESDLEALITAIGSSPVPVAVWVGPSGSDATGAAADLVAAAAVSGVAPGSRLEVTEAVASGHDLGGKTAIGETVGSEIAEELGLVDNAAPVLGQFIVGLPGVETRVVENRREPVTPVRFGQLELTDQLFHTMASPPVAYLLALIAGSLLVFELFTAGVGIAGMVGALCGVGAAYGLAVLPTNTWAVVLLVAAFPAFAVDVQTGVPRFWTGVGTVFLVASSFGLFVDGPPSWITLVAGIVGVLLAMLGGMPAMVRTRFSTPTIGRDWMIGETGVAVDAVDPDGVVTVRDAPWRARTNRATPVAAGAAVRVVSIDGLTLEVEPIDGAARDYRDR